MQLFRKALWSVALILLLINFTLWGWHEGYETGYSAAMAAVVLQIETPENYLIKKFDIKNSKRYNDKQEHK